MQWFVGIMSCDQSAPPNRDKHGENWKPVLSIWVHVCTLPARLKILDKLLKLHVNYAWNMEPEPRRQESLKALEGILSDAGLHGGAVCLTKDTKKSGKGQTKFAWVVQKLAIFYQSYRVSEQYRVSNMEKNMPGYHIQR